MLKKEFTFTDYDGKERTIEAYFHLTKNDAIDLNDAFKEEGGLINYLKSLIKESKEHPDDPPSQPFIKFVRQLVSKSYGVRPKYDRGLFLKEDDNGNPLVRSFKGTPAYDDFVFGLLSGKEDLAEFTNGIMPEVDETQIEEAKKMLASEGIEFPVTEPSIEPHEV